MLAPDRKEQFGPGRLWSLWDMLRVYGSAYVRLGTRIETARVIFTMAENEEHDSEARNLYPGEIEALRNSLDMILHECRTLGLTVSEGLIAKRAKDLPQTLRELDLLVDAVLSEMGDKLFLFVPSHRAAFFENDDLLTTVAKQHFPRATQQMREAGNAFAAGLSTACVFHCMRALEHGMGALADSVGLTFDVQNWQNILDQIEAKIRAEAATPKTPQRDEHLKFFSEAASEFRHFKDGWRNHVSHNKVSYEEAEALKIMEHVRDFIETLSTRLSEPV